MSKKIILDMSNIDKIYPNGVFANNKVNFQLREGEIHALMGENGAGKSTLMKILFGMEQPSGGEIFLYDKKVEINSSLKAISLGIGMVHQHFMLVPNLTVAENIILGMEPKSFGFIDYARAYQNVKKVMDQYNFQVDPNAKIKDLSVGKKQKVEILKALYRGAKILILDEPTAVLTPQETQELFLQLKELSASNYSIIFISHKINEIKQICDKMSIMRSGMMVTVREVGQMSVEEISAAMIGKELVKKVTKQKISGGEAVLKTIDLTYQNDEEHVIVNRISLSVKRGQILGIAGVEGNGQREFVDCITGLATAHSGKIFLNNVSYDELRSIKKIRNNGLSHIPEDRMTLGVALEESIEDNLISTSYTTAKFSQGIFLRSNKMKDNAKKMIQQYRIVTDSEKTSCKMLSGGNMQKVVAAREMNVEPDILIADQPTRGIDVGAASFIHEKIIEIRNNHKAVLLISADINEILELSDAVVVFYNGEISAYFENINDINEEELGLYMLGLKKMSPEEIGKVAN